MTATRPWMGLAAYSSADAELFHGRRAETHDLLALVERDRLGVLFGPSGVGKTSILQAGLFPALRARRTLAVPVRLAHDDGAGDLDDQVLKAVLGAARAASVDAAPARGGEGLWAYFHGRGHGFWTEEQWPVTPVLVLDQFEEIFTLGRSSEERRQRSRRLLESLSELIDNRPPPRLRDQLRAGTSDGDLDAFNFDPVPVRVLLSLREDYLAPLEGLRGLFPTVRQNRLRLGGLTRAQAHEAVAGPGERFGVLAPRATDAILDLVAAGADAGEDEDRPVEPALLSLVCDELYRARDGLITPEQVARQKRGILRRFYDGAFEALAAAERRPARLFVEEQLVSSGGHRDSRSLDDATTRFGLTAAGLTALVDRRLLRYEDRPGGARRVELSHDVLLSVAQESRAERAREEAIAAAERQQQEQLAAERQRTEQAEAERAVAEASARKARRQLLVIASLLVAALGGIGIGVAGMARARRTTDQATRASAAADFDLANLYLAQGAAETPRAMAHLARALRTRPDEWRAAERLASILTERNLPVPIGEVMWHGDRVAAASFSPDGRRVLTASVDGTARLWDAESGHRTAVISHGSAVHWASFSPDGGLVLTMGEDSIRLWEAATARPRAAIQRPPQRLLWSNFSPDGAHIVTVWNDGVVRLFATATGDPWGAEISHRGPLINSAEFSPDGKRIVTASQDGTARVWEAATGKPSFTFSRGGAPMRTARFSADGTRVVTSSLQGLAFFDAVGGWPLGTSPFAATDASFDPVGRQTVSVSFGTSRLAWVEGRQPDRTLTSGLEVTAASFSPDGRRVLTASADGTARLWDAYTGQPAVEPMRHRSAISAAAFSPDGRRVVTGSWDRTARLWDVSGAPARPLVLAATGPIVSASLSEDGKRIAITARDPMVSAEDWNRGKPEGFALTTQIWSSEAGTPLPSLPIRRQVKAGTPSLTVLAPDSRSLVTSDARVWQIWTLPVGRAIGTSNEMMGHVTAVAFSQDGSRVITVSLDQVAVWNATTGRLARPPRHESLVSSAALSPDGSRAVIAERDGTAYLWNVASGERDLPMRHELAILDASFSPDGQRVVTASADKTAQLWDARTAQQLGVSMRHLDAVRAARFNPDGDLVATASEDGTARLWNAHDGRPIGESMAHDHPVSALAFLPDGKRLVTRSEGGDTRVWDARTGKPLGETRPSSGWLFGVGGNRLLMGASDVHEFQLDDIAALEGPAPSWFAGWVEGIAGVRFDDAGVLQPVPALVPLPSKLPDDGFARLARWFLQAGGRRPISPGWSQTMRQWVDQRVSTRPSSLEQWLPGDPLIIAADAAWPELSDATIVDFRARYAVTHAAVNAEEENDRPVRPRQALVHFHAARAWQRIGKKAEARAAAETAARLDPGRPEYAELARTLGP